MFSSIQDEKKEDLKSKHVDVKPLAVMIASARPLMHVRRPPSPPIEMPSISLHLDRHKIMSILSATGISVEMSSLPQFTRNGISTAFDENGGPPDVLFLCGSGTSWDADRLIVEDGFGSADFLDFADLKLVIPEQPKILIAIGAFSDRFGHSVVEEAVAPITLILDDTGIGARDGYQMLALFLTELLRNHGFTSASEVKTIFDSVAVQTHSHEQSQETSLIRLYAAHAAIAPVIPLKLYAGNCRVRDSHGIASLRAKQSWRVFRQISFEGRSPIMSKIINAIEKNCTHTIVLLHGESGCGRTELAAQIMLWYLDRAKLTCALWGNCDTQSDVIHQARRHPPRSAAPHSGLHFRTGPGAARCGPCE